MFISFEYQNSEKGEKMKRKIKHKWKSHFTSTLLFATIITAIIAIILQYTKLGAVIFAVVSVALLGAYRHVENQENEGK